MTKQSNDWIENAYKQYHITMMNVKDSIGMIEFRKAIEANQPSDVDVL